MTLIRHCIIDTNINIVVNIIEYDTIQTGVPSGLDSNLLCVQSDTGEIGGVYAKGVITNPTKVENFISPFPTPTTNTDYQEYLKFVAERNTPTPAEE